MALSFSSGGDAPPCESKFDYEVGEYYDVYRCEGVVRFKAVRFAGKAILHCHMVKHEDQGLMGWINVTGDGEYPLNSSPQNNLFTCSDVFTNYTTAKECATLNGSPDTTNPPDSFCCSYRRSLLFGMASRGCDMTC